MCIMGGMKCANLSRGAHKRVRVYRRFIMNKEELVKEISKKTKLSQKVSSDVLSATLEIIQKTVAKGKKVTLVGLVLGKLVRELLELAETRKLVKN